MSCADLHVADCLDSDKHICGSGGLEHFRQFIHRELRHENRREMEAELYKCLGCVDDKLTAKMVDFLESATLRMVQKYQSTEGSTGSRSPSSTLDVIDTCTESLGDIAQPDSSDLKIPASFDVSDLCPNVAPAGQLSQSPYAVGNYLDQYPILLHSASEKDLEFWPFGKASRPFTDSDHIGLDLTSDSGYGPLELDTVHQSSTDGVSTSS
jgi:hypothetical protein